MRKEKVDRVPKAKIGEVVQQAALDNAIEVVATLNDDGNTFIVVATFKD